MLDAAVTRPSEPEFIRLDLSAHRRVLTVGDIHGRFDLLEQKLDEFSFDPELDRLILLGDLIDRGNESGRALEWCSRPGVLRVRGNHEDLLIKASADKEGQDLLLHLRNGGGWFMDIEDAATRDLWANTLLDAPVAIEALTPGRRRVGFVHADVPTPSWNDMISLLTSPDPTVRAQAAWLCMWDRDRFDDLKRHDRYGALADYRCGVADIDHVFFGHSITREPVVHDNCSWIDTGAYKNDVLTLVDVDAWIASSTSMSNAA